VRSVLVDDAFDEALEAEEELDKRSRGLGALFQDDLSDVIELLMVFPESGRMLEQHSVRRMNLRQFPYHVIYRLEEDVLTIYAVAHHSRQPQYWWRRLRQ
jgi:toxin ParE1/3/4